MTALARSSDQPAKKTCCCAERRMAHAGPETSERNHGHDQHHVRHSHAADAAPINDNAVRDPVCGMVVDPRTTQHRSQYQGRTYHFCSNGCRENFVADPQKYLRKSPEREASVPEGTMYTCPMHPQIR